MNNCKEMSNPLVSVIIPNYNYARYLDQRMESILSQTYQNYEVIILDDKSTDNSVEIIQKYKSHPRVAKVIINETNSGSPFKQWERGINEASGEIIWIAESDDFCTPDLLETLVNLYVENNCVLAFCRSIFVDKNGKTIGDSSQMAEVDADITMEGKFFIKKYLAYYNEIQNASCAIFSKTAAMEIDKHFTDFKGAGDWFFWINLAEHGIVSFSNKKCNRYRQHNNTTLKVVKNGMEFREMKTIYEWLLYHSYLDEVQFEKCKTSDLSYLTSREDIPINVKIKLYRMWNMPLKHIISMCILEFRRKLKKIIKI